jgi:hypothetical protein
MNLETGAINEQTVRIETYLKYSKKGWHWDKTHSVTLRSGNPDELLILATFLGVICDDKIPAIGGSYLVLPLNEHIDRDFST